MPRQGIPEQVPLHYEFIGDDATALLKPVIDQLPLVTQLDQHAVDLQRATTHRDLRQLTLREVAHLPAPARQTGTR